MQCFHSVSSSLGVAGRMDVTHCSSAHSCLHFGGASCFHCCPYVFEEVMIVALEKELFFIESVETHSAQTSDCSWKPRKKYNTVRLYIHYPSFKKKIWKGQAALIPGWGLHNCLPSCSSWFYTFCSFTLAISCSHRMKWQETVDIKKKRHERTGTY
jgi:hypothetical protein